MGTFSKKFFQSYVSQIRNNYPTEHLCTPKGDPECNRKGSGDVFQWRMGNRILHIRSILYLIRFLELDYRYDFWYNIL